MKANHYTFIAHICDADYRAVDQDNTFLQQYTVEYMIQLHETMIRRESKG